MLAPASVQPIVSRVHFAAGRLMRENRIAFGGECLVNVRSLKAFLINRVAVLRHVAGEVHGVGNLVSL